MIKGSFDLLEGNSWCVKTLSGVMAMVNDLMEITFILHVTSHDHLFKGLCDFMTLWIEASHCKSRTWSYVFSLSRDLLRLHDQEFL